MDKSQIKITNRAISWVAALCGTRTERYRARQNDRYTWQVRGVM